MTPRLAVLHHLERPFLGLAEAPLRAAGLALDERSPHRGDPLPALGEVDGILALGGAQSAVDLAAEPLLAAEAALLREAVAAEVPVLGVCLGGQVLSAALGGAVRRAPRRTVAWRSLAPAPGAAGDPIFGALAPPVPALHWNEDVFSLPPGAVELLGRTGEGVEAFRAGPCAWGLQFHPEADQAVLDDWYAHHREWLAEGSVMEADARRADAEHLPAQAGLAERLFGAFGRIVGACAAR